MAIERHDGNEPAVDSGAARTDGGEHRAGPCGEHRAGDRPIPEERRSRSELHAALRATDTGTDSPARPVNRDAPRTTPDGAWEWKGLRLEPDQNREARAEILARRQAEGRDVDGNYSQDGITPAMRTLEGSLDHAQLVPDTEKFALKSGDRFKEKLAKLIMQEPDKPASEHAHEIHDGIRYTFLLDSENYTDGVASGCKKLGSMGFELLVLKNTWSNEEYKGINSRWLDPATDLPFEIQFHTPDSWSAKQQTHDAYEQISDQGTSAEIKERLRAYQQDVNRQIAAPAGWQEIKDYRKEGW